MEQFLYLQTTGHKSGNTHEIEIWYVERDGRFYIVAEHRERAHWVQNIIKMPAVHIRVGDLSANGTARTVYPDAEPELAAAVSALMDVKYQWSDGLIVELTPDTNPTQL